MTYNDYLKRAYESKEVLVDDYEQIKKDVFDVFFLKMYGYIHYF